MTRKWATKQVSATFSIVSVQCVREESISILKSGAPIYKITSFNHIDLFNSAKWAFGCHWQLLKSCWGWLLAGGRAIPCR